MGRHQQFQQPGGITRLPLAGLRVTRNHIGKRHIPVSRLCCRCQFCHEHGGGRKKRFGLLGLRLRLRDRACRACLGTILLRRLHHCEKAGEQRQCFGIRAKIQTRSLTLRRQGQTGSHRFHCIHRQTPFPGGDRPRPVSKK